MAEDSDVLVYWRDVYPIMQRAKTRAIAGRTGEMYEALQAISEAMQGRKESEIRPARLRNAVREALTMFGDIREEADDAATDARCAEGWFQRGGRWVCEPA